MPPRRCPAARPPPRRGRPAPRARRPGGRGPATGRRRSRRPPLPRARAALPPPPTPPVPHLGIVREPGLAGKQSSGPVVATGVQLGLRAGEDEGRVEVQLAR